MNNFYYECSLHLAIFECGNQSVLVQKFPDKSCTIPWMRRREDGRRDNTMCMASPIKDTCICPFHCCQFAIAVPMNDMLLRRVLVLPQKKNCTWLVAGVLVKMPFHWNQETIFTMREVDSDVQCHTSAEMLPCIFEFLFIAQKHIEASYSTVTWRSQKAAREHEIKWLNQNQFW